MQVLKNLNLTQVRLMLYSCRHGGASEDHAWLGLCSKFKHTEAGRLSPVCVRHEKHARSNLTLQQALARRLRDVAHLKGTSPGRLDTTFDPRYDPTQNCRQETCFWTGFLESVPIGCHLQQAGCGVVFLHRELMDLRVVVHFCVVY